MQLKKIIGIPVNLDSFKNGRAKRANKIALYAWHHNALFELSSATC